MNEYCEGKTNRGGKCHKPAGWGTDHPGVGRCVHHEWTDPLFPAKYKSRKILKGYALCRSPIELEIFKDLDFNSEVITFTPEPFDIPYEYKGKVHKYIPDILINYNNGNQKLIEIKTIEDVVKPRNIAKYNAAKQFCNMKGFKFEIWTRKVKGSLSYPIEGEFDHWIDAYRELKTFKEGRHKKLLWIDNLIFLSVFIGMVIFFFFMIITKSC